MRIVTRVATASLVLAALLAAGAAIVQQKPQVVADRFPECTAEDQNQIPLPWWCR